MELDTRYTTDEFLKGYFPDTDRFQKMMKNHPLAEIEASKYRYLEFKSRVNKERARSGKDKLTDRDLVHIIKSAEGLLELPKPR